MMLAITIPQAVMNPIVFFGLTDGDTWVAMSCTISNGLQRVGFIRSATDSRQWRRPREIWPLSEPWPRTKMLGHEPEICDRAGNTTCHFPGQPAGRACSRLRRAGER